MAIGECEVAGEDKFGLVVDDSDVKVSEETRDYSLT